MSYSAYGFTGQPGQDQTIQPGLAQYMAQGQLGINPGQAQVAASNPISAAGQYNLAKALMAGNQQAPLPAQQPVSPDAAQMALANPVGQVGPTPQNLQLAQLLQQDPQQLGQMMNAQNFMGGQ